MPLNLQIPYTAPQSTLAGFQALGAGIQDFIQRQREMQQQAEALQYQNLKNQTTLQHIAGLKNPQGQPYVTPEQMLEIQSATNPKKQSALIEGILGNIAFDTARQAQIPSLTSVAGPPGSGLPSSTVYTGPGHIVQPPFTPRTGVTPPAPGIPSVPYFQGGPNSATPVQAPFKPTIEPITGPDGKPVNVFHTAPNKYEIFDPTGNRLELTDAEKAAYTNTGHIPLRTSAKSFQVANDPNTALAQNSEAVKNFDETVGKRYGLKSADLFRINFTTPGGSTSGQVDPNNLTGITFAKIGTNTAVDTATANKDPLNTDVLVPNPSGGIAAKPIRIPLSDWNTIVNQWSQLPRAGNVPGGVSVQSNAPVQGGSFTPTTGTVIKQNGVTYKYDGQNWVAQQ